MGFEFGFLIFERGEKFLYEVECIVCAIFVFFLWNGAIFMNARKILETCNSPDVVSSTLGRGKKCGNVKVDGSCERNSSRCIIFRLGQFFQVRGRGEGGGIFFPLTLPLKFIFIFSSYYLRIT